MSNQMIISLENNHILTESVMCGIDISNQIASYSDKDSYTATQDCWAIFWTNGDRPYKLDNETVVSGADHENVVLMKKGQTLAKAGSYTTPTMRIYGVKR